jgi:uncharacterized protein (TIGR02246 family)
VIEKMTDNFNRHDATAMASVYAEDGDIVNVYGTRLKGQPAIKKGLSWMLENLVPNATLRFVGMDIRFIRPDVAIAHVTNELTEHIEGRESVPQHHELSIRVFAKTYLGDARRSGAEVRPWSIVTRILTSTEGTRVSCPPSPLAPGPSTVERPP